MHSVIVDYSRYEGATFPWIDVVLYKLYSVFGILPINALFLFITIMVYNSEKDDVENEETKKELRLSVYAILILIVIADIIGTVL